MMAAVFESPLQMAVTRVGKLAWAYGRSHHIIKYKTTAAGIHPHRIAHEFGHIQLAHEARAAGRGKLFVVPDSSKERALRSISKDARKLRSQGPPQEAIAGEPFLFP